jgi:3-hydroxybutyrate dehydrogenase
MALPSDFLTGKRALVTGAASGIGRASAVRLAEAGAHVLVADRDEGPAKEVAEQVGGTALTVDLSDLDGIDDLRLSTDLAVDVLVNNAGIQHVANVEDFPPEKWDAIIAINLSSAFHTTRLALPGMKAKGWGRVINVASTHGLVASAQKSAYVASKHGIIGFTKAVALETATTGVTVNAICPGWVLTPLVQKQVDARAQQDGVDDAEAKRRLLAEKQPSLQFTTPEQLGELAVFLCTPAADNVRGVAWNVDGGWVAQ